MVHRRNLLISALAVPGWGLAATPGVRLPHDFGAHPTTSTEWWYATGWLEAAGRTWGFQVTFFRRPTGLAPDHPSRFAARELVFAHAALTDLAAGRQLHDQRIARAGFGVASTTEGRTDVRLRDWFLTRDDTGYTTRVHSPAAGFEFDLRLDATQPPLVQGQDGISKKGPAPENYTRYYSEPQLAVSGTLRQGATTTAVTGRAWLDHEWGDALMPSEADGWDWLGMNLDDGGALTAFRLRRPDGTSVWAGGSHRPQGGTVRTFQPGEVTFTPGRTWRSPASQARYPVSWTVDTPAGRFEVVSLLDAQEIDSRASTGNRYWEGLCELRDAATGARRGRGYLEMTGYASRLRL